MQITIEKHKHIQTNVFTLTATDKRMYRRLLGSRLHGRIALNKTRRKLGGEPSGLHRHLVLTDVSIVREQKTDCPQTFRGEEILRRPTGFKNLFCLLSFGPNREETSLFLLRADTRRNSVPRSVSFGTSRKTNGTSRKTNGLIPSDCFTTFSHFYSLCPSDHHILHSNQ